MTLEEKQEEEQESEEESKRENQEEGDDAKEIRRKRRVGETGVGEEGRRSMRWCGDWSGRLKLLRYESRGNRVVLTFSSDYAHGYSGFRARVSARPGESRGSGESRG